MNTGHGTRRLKFLIVASLLSFGVILAQASPARSQGSGPSTEPVQVTVTVVAPHGASAPPPAREDIVARQDGQPRPVLAWVPGKKPRARLELAILRVYLPAAK